MGDVCVCGQMDGNIHKEKHTTQYHFYFIEAFVLYAFFHTL